MRWGGGVRCNVFGVAATELTNIFCLISLKLMMLNERLGEIIIIGIAQ
jgi:hypothetical protein